MPSRRDSQILSRRSAHGPPAGNRLTELAERAHMTRPSMLELVDALERQGYVARIPDLTDRRAKLIRLTDTGWVAYMSGFHAVIQLQAAWAAQLGGDTFTSPARRLGHIDDCGRHVYLALFWAEDLASQAEDPALAAAFAPLAKELRAKESTIAADLLAVQGSPVDLGGYYRSDPAKADAVMRPSKTLNEALSLLRRE